jgi:hypothetical protein
VDQTQFLLEFATICSAMLIMVRIATRYRIFVRREPRRCASCRRQLPCECH